MTGGWNRLRALARRPRAAGGVPLTPAEIRDLRGPRTRAAFARDLGVSVATVYMWEVGRMRPSTPNLTRLRQLVNVLRRSRARPTRS